MQIQPGSGGGYEQYLLSTDVAPEVVLVKVRTSVATKKRPNNFFFMIFTSL